MKSSYVALGIVMIIASIFFLSKEIDIYRIEKYGEVVKMEIMKLPRNCDITKRSYFMDVQFKGEIFKKRIPVRYCYNHKVGELVDMKYLEGETSILYPTETVWKEFIAIGVLILVGMLSIIYGVAGSKRGVRRVRTPKSNLYR